MKAKIICGALFVFVASAAAVPKDNLADLLARIDESALKFEAMRAKVHYRTHTAVIDDDSDEAGIVIMKKMAANEVQGRIDFIEPAENKKTVTFERRRAQVWVPKSKTLTVYDLGDKGEQLDRFLMLGFGTTGTELARDYTMRTLASETIRGQKVTKIELLPKAAEVRKVVSKLEMWIPESPGAPYPIQEKIYEKNPADYRVVTYSDLQINPSTPAEALKLKLPAGYKTINASK